MEARPNLWEKIKINIFRQDVIGKKLEKFENIHIQLNKNFITPTKSFNNKQPKEPSLNENLKKFQQTTRNLATPKISPTATPNVKGGKNEGQGLG